MSEDVLVVPTDDLAPLFRGRTFDLIRDDAAPILDAIGRGSRFLARDVAEVSPEFRQIIPYVVTRFGDSYFLLERTTKQTEVRLHKKLSLGIGGHINPDASGIEEGLQKELREEVEISCPYTLNFVGILNDESTEVARVHLGVVYVLDASTDEVRVLETEKMTGQWTPRAALAPLRDRFESWSQVVYDQFIER